MRACDEKLRSSLMEAMKLDNARLEEEMKHCEPHVFSEKFERCMEKLMTVQRRKGKVISCVRYIAAAVVVLLLTGGILFVGSEDLRASELSIDILEWLDEFFTVKNGVDDRSDTAVLFDESQIGYLPEGFEKVGELVKFAGNQYEYKNSNGDYILIDVCRNKATLQIDSEQIKEEIHLNEAGYEYTQTIKTDSNENLIMWKDVNEIYYYITATVEINELIKIMNSISY